LIPAIGKQRPRSLEDAFTSEVGWSRHSPSPLFQTPV
jgi:hypothetical protein